jgi:hypothetical protein
VDWSVRQAQFHSSVEEFEFTERIHSQKTTSLTACHLDVLSASRTYAAHWPHTAFREASDPAPGRIVAHSERGVPSATSIHFRQDYSPQVGLRHGTRASASPIRSAQVRCQAVVVI